MSDQGGTVLGPLRKPEYTGENRCLPCTVVNLAIAAVASALLAVVAVELAVAAFGCAVLAIYLRGYLVPGTPTLTKRYLPDRVLAAFDDHPLEESSESPLDETLAKIEREREQSVDPERFLREAGVLEPSDDGSEYRLTDGFADLVADRMASTENPGREAVADVFDTDPDAVTEKDREYPAFTVDRRVRKWPAEGAFLADVATHRALRERTDRWMEVPQEQRLEILERLRSFHDTCPSCGGAVAFTDETVESCCRAYEVVTIGCRDCGERLREFDPEAVPTSGPDKGIRP